VSIYLPLLEVIGYVEEWLGSWAQSTFFILTESTKIQLQVGIVSIEIIMPYVGRIVE
jgi:hypothetical protein